jgi:hypothetical protein
MAAFMRLVEAAPFFLQALGKRGMLAASQTLPHHLQDAVALSSQERGAVDPEAWEHA